MPDIDVSLWPTLYQQTWPVRRKYDVRHVDLNLNLTDALFTALPVMVWAAWDQAPPSRRALWQPRLWRFRGQNVSPDVLLGGLAETITVDKWADMRNAGIAARWRDRWTWRNKSRAADFVQEPANIRVLTLEWLPLIGPQHIRARARIAAWKSYLGMTSAQQQFVQTQAQATIGAGGTEFRFAGGRREAS